jgi:serine/threonine protein phosphatase PrpC
MNLMVSREARFCVDGDMKTAEIVSLSGGAVAVFSARSPQKTTANEDAVAVIPCGQKAAVLVVADGVGGGPAGEQASSRAVQVLRRTLKGSVREGDLMRTAIIDGIEAANEEIEELGLGAATTLAAVEIQDNQVRPYHVGDSMILVVGQRGKIKLQTVSHSPVGYAIESGLLDESEAMHHEDRHLVSNLLGTPEMRIELGPTIALARHDTIVTRQ